MLLHVPEVLTADEITLFRDALAQAEWADGRGTVGAQGASVKHNRQLPDDSPLAIALGKRVQAALGRQPLYHAATLPQRMLPPRFNCYQGGGHYGFHIDGAVMRLNDGQQLRTDIACTLFLNAPESYDGGELIVSDTYGEHAIKLPAGDLIVYPASSLHRVAPVTRGQRLAAFFWVQSLVRDDAQRRMLFELDQSVQTLTATGAGADVVLSLTGLYHNLLRQWGDT